MTMDASPVPAYVYAATVIRWVDGDTVDLDVDLGFHIHTMARCRLLGLNTPERGQPGAGEATHHARSVAPDGAPVVIESQLSPDKYGRLLVTVHSAGVNVNRSLLDGGFAVAYNGGRR